MQISPFALVYAERLRYHRLSENFRLINERKEEKKNECWSIDLIDRSSLSKHNKNYKFIFTIFDNHTKYAWAIPPKDKSERSSTTAFKKLIETSERKPDKIWSDRG